MSGGFYIVEHMEELEEFLNIGKEIICYTCKENVADKIKYYSSTMQDTMTNSSAYAKQDLNAACVTIAGSSSSRKHLRRRG
jgi:spore maturation protein CgeB